MNPSEIQHFIDPKALIGPGTKVWHFAVILEGAVVGLNCSIGACAEIGRNAIIGSGTRIGHGVFLPPWSVIGENVFIAPNVTFTDDKHPRVNNAKYDARPPLVKDNASIGAGAIILPGIRIGKSAMIGAGAVVTKDVADGETVVGIPATQMVNRRDAETQREEQK